jgi:hypothetical protein
VDSLETAAHRWSGEAAWWRSTAVEGLSVAGNNVTESCALGRERGK